MTLEKNTLLNERYRILEILGQGGMGAVYRALDENLGVIVAVKENFFLTEEYARQFRREATILAGLRHPNLPRVSDHFVIDEQGQYLVMDYIEGEDLRERMERNGTVTEREAVQIGVAICDALAYLHSRQMPIIHRDIKPGNVKISPDGQIYLVDFGLAKVMESSQATTTGARAMTPGYSPPEQYGTARTDPRSDLYSLGATLYASISGVIPEDGLARATGNAQLTPLRKLNPRLNPHLAKVLERSLALKVDERYQTAEEFKAALLSAYAASAPLASVRRASQPPGLPPNIPPANNTEGFNGNSGDFPVSLSTPRVSTPISVPLPEPKRTSKMTPRDWLLSLVFIIAAGLIGGLLMQNGEWRRVVASWLLTDTPTAPVETSLPSAITITSIVATLTSSPSPTVTSTPTSLPSPTVTFTPRPTLTPTEIPTLASRATLIATPYGGGSGEIVFVSNRNTGIPQLWLMDSSGGSIRQITNRPNGACQPDFSPDGMKIVFISPCYKRQVTYPTASLHVINIDGTGETALPFSPEGDFDPAWSPDGNFIAFTSLRDGRMMLYRLNITTGEVTRLSDGSAYDQHPAWSPDGSMIAFTRTKPGYPMQIWTMSADGSNVEQFSLSGDINNMWPVWSPDGRIIYFCQTKASSYFPRLRGMYLIDRKLAKEFKIPEKVDPKAGPVIRPSLSPDGQWFIFESWVDGNNHEIYIMSSIGNQLIALTSLQSLDFYPDWRPRVTTP